MKNQQLSNDSQDRLLAYTTAAGLGAFFAGQNVGAQVIESAAFAPYPHTIIPGVGIGPYGAYHYFSIDGGKTNFNLAITGAPITTHPTVQFPSQAVDIYGFGTVGFGTNTTILANAAAGAILTPTFSPPDAGGHTNNAYAVCFLGGTAINAATASAPWYEPRLALCYFGAPNPYGPPGGFYAYLDSKYITSGSLAFEFTGSVDGQTHFGYMDVQVNTSKTNGIPQIDSVVIKDVYYNATANAGISVPTSVIVSSIQLGAGGAVTINFTSNDNSQAGTFTLQSSPTLGASAVWTPDPAATINLITSANPAGGIDQASYQAVTTTTGGGSKFYRLVESSGS